MDLADALGPTHGDTRLWVTAQLLSIDTAANRAVVSIDGGPAVALPYLPGVYQGINTVFVLRDPYRAGAGQLVLGPGAAQPPEDVPPPPPPPPPPADEQTPATPRTTTETALIRPTWSGTYRLIRGAWDRWNTERYGGRSTLYQGNAFGSGELVGLATYGNQIRALGALEITRIRVTTPLATGSGSVTLQGAPHSSKPGGGPQPSGATASGSSTVDLSSPMREAFRTGAFKSLATVGGNYRATRGTSHPSGMVLAITYVRPA